MSSTTSHDTADDARTVQQPAQLWTDGRGATEFLEKAIDELAGIEGQLLDLLPVRPGDAVLDVGCGTGMALGQLAARVGPSGRAVGVDTSAELVTANQDRFRDRPHVEVRLGDACDLPFPDGTFAAVRSERVVEHVDDPAQALREMVRVTAPGGQILVADPDHGMWSPDLDVPVELSRRVMTWWAEHVPNPWAARQLPRLLAEAGAVDIRVQAFPLVLRSLAAADAITWITRSPSAARAAAVMDEAEAARWQEALTGRDREGQFLLLGLVVSAIGRRP